MCFVHKSKQATDLQSLIPHTLDASNAQSLYIYISPLKRSLMGYHRKQKQPNNAPPFQVTPASTKTKFLASMRIRRRPLPDPSQATTKLTPFIRPSHHPLMLGRERRDSKSIATPCLSSAVPQLESQEQHHSPPPLLHRPLSSSQPKAT